MGRRKKEARLPEEANTIHGPIPTIEKKLPDELGPKTASVKDDSQSARVIVCWKDSKGRDRTTEYTMADLSVSESISEEFTGAKKKTHIHVTLEGHVLGKQ